MTARAATAGGSGTAHTLVSFDQPGTLSTATGKGRFPVTVNATLVSVRAVCNTAPTGASVIVDVNKNGTTVFTTQANRPTITASAFTSGDSVPDVTTLSAGDYLSVDIDQVGSTVAGADLTVVAELILAAGTSDAPEEISVVIGQVTNLQATLDAKIPASIADAKGDLIVATAADTVARKAVGTDGQVLQADSASTGGVKWATPASGGGGLGRFRSGRYYMAGGDFALRTSTIGPVNGRGYAIPVWVAQDTTIDRVTAEVTVGATTGGLLRFAVYDDAVGYYPGSLVVDYGTFSSTATGVVGDSAGTATVLSGGHFYWFVMAEQGLPVTGATVRAIVASVVGMNPLGYSAAANANPPLCIIAPSQFAGAPPATFPAALATTTAAPAILFKVT